MGPGASLDTIIKKFSFIYGYVKSYDLLMRDFYRADQGERRKQSHLLPQGLRVSCLKVRDKFPHQTPLSKEQKLLKDRLLHDSQKNIRDSVKYCHADATVDYMTFLEECRKAEDEDRIGKSKSKGKLKAAAATIPSTQSDEMTKQLKKQEQQFDTMMGKMKTLVTTLQTQTARPQHHSGRETLPLG